MVLAKRYAYVAEHDRPPGRIVLHPDDYTHLALRFHFLPPLPDGMCRLFGMIIEIDTRCEEGNAIPYSYGEKPVFSDA